MPESRNSSGHEGHKGRKGQRHITGLIVAISRVIAMSLTFVSFVSFVFLFPLRAQESRRTVWDGIYTDAQAARGRELYRQSCGHCHRDDLTGGGSEVGAPPLRGPIFFYRWLHQPVAEMFLTIGTTMPQNKPDSLTPQTVVDIVSFLLKENDMPAGQAELAPDVEALKAILVTEKGGR